MKIRVDDPHKDYDRVPLNETPIVINWKGKIGYGDIVSPISYAYNLAEKNATDVILNFHWKASGPEKFKDEDPETIQDWIAFIDNWMEKPEFFDVEINHIYDSKLSYNHDNYSFTKEDEIYHNLRYHKHGGNDMANSHRKYKELVLVTTVNHKEQFADYDPNKMWKDPLGGTPGGYAWPRVADLLQKRGWKIHHVHYSDPIHLVVKKMTSARAVIGYHGAGMWLARWLQKPMFIFSKGKVTKKAFPWAAVNEQWNDFQIENIEEQIVQQMINKETIDDGLRYYLTNSNFHRLRRERT
tara:strand:+ start:13479 stop:14369 length:891 start_codon:yes stop_codon:yes gene_type:complete